MTVMPCPQCDNYLSDNAYGTKCEHCGWVVGSPYLIIGKVAFSHITIERSQNLLHEPARGYVREKEKQMSEENKYENMDEAQLNKQLTILTIKEREMELKNLAEQQELQKKYDEQEMIRRSIETCVSIMRPNSIAAHEEQNTCQKEAAEKITELLKRLAK